MKELTAILFFLWVCQAVAEPGDALIVTGNLVNVRSGPSLDDPVIMRLEQGRKLVEVRREGDWVEIKSVRKDIESAWIHQKLVAKVSAPVPTPVPEYEDAEQTALFNLFNRAFIEMNENIKSETGNTYFLKAKNLGDGVVEITATDAWLNSPREGKEKDLSEIFTIWDAAMVDLSHITVFIVNEGGERLMTMFR